MSVWRTSQTEATTARESTGVGVDWKPIAAVLQGDCGLAKRSPRLHTFPRGAAEAIQKTAIQLHKS